MFEATPPEPEIGGALRSSRFVCLHACADALADLRPRGEPRRHARVRLSRRRLSSPALGSPARRRSCAAYAYYLPSPETPEGGELELFRCVFDEGKLIATESVRLIEPRPNRLVVFEVSDRSLHQVREVLAGLRPSLAGWFYR